MSHGPGRIAHKEVKDTLNHEPQVAHGGPSLEGLVTRRCEYCEGTGEVDVGAFVPVYETCPICDGNREVRVPGDYTGCRKCEGTGEEDVGEFFEWFEPCEKCHGTGWAPPPPVYM